ncbi:MAG: hypothetical protein ND895_11720 [Pyrinomonadaceae bacterium]|nr:hypothetical protein [Pyrinomonadaceae bacterium]
MQTHEVRRVMIALTPLVSLVLLLIVYGSLVMTYVRCVNIDCQSIPQNLNKILVTVPANPEMVVPNPNVSKANQDGKFPQHEYYAARYGGRITWLFLRLVYLISCLTAFAVACFVIYRSFAHKGKRAIIWVFVIVIVLLTGFGVLLYKHPAEYMSIFLDLFKLTIENDLNNITELMARLNSFGFAACLSVVLAICAILYSPDSNSSPDGLKQLSSKMKYLQLMLYVGTIVLVAGVLLIRSLYQWSLAFVSQNDQAIKVAESFYSKLLASEGGFFTLMLIAVYLPAALILRRRADSLDGLPEKSSDKEQLLKDYNLTFSFTESLPRLLAILGPLLAGPIGELFSRLSK